MRVASVTRVIAVALSCSSCASIIEGASQTITIKHPVA